MIRGRNVAFLPLSVGGLLAYMVVHPSKFITGGLIEALDNEVFNFSLLAIIDRA